MVLTARLSVRRGSYKPKYIGALLSTVKRTTAGHGNSLTLSWGEWFHGHTYLDTLYKVTDLIVNEWGGLWSVKYLHVERAGATRPPISLTR